MDIEIDIRRTMVDRGREFTLNTRFSSVDDTVVLFGPSGAGKSLTLQAIAGLLRPDQGRIHIGARTLFDSSKGIDLPVRERRIGYLFQDYALFPHLSVRHNIGFGLRRLWQWRQAPAQRRQVDDMLDVFELTALAEAYPRDLSGGQRQRVALARALIGRPDVLLLDEPFAALNALLRVRMRDELARIRAHFRVPVILISHDQEDVEAFAETLVMVENGAVKAVWPFKQLRDTPAPGALQRDRLQTMRGMLAQSGWQSHADAAPT